MPDNEVGEVGVWQGRHTEVCTVHTAETVAEATRPQEPEVPEGGNPGGEGGNPGGEGGNTGGEGGNTGEVTPPTSVIFINEPIYRRILRGF